MATVTLTLNNVSHEGNSSQLVVTGGSESDRITFVDLAVELSSQGYATFDVVKNHLTLNMADTALIFGSSDSGSIDCYIWFKGDCSITVPNSHDGVITGRGTGDSNTALYFKGSSDVIQGNIVPTGSYAGRLSIYLTVSAYNNGYSYRTLFYKTTKVVCYGVVSFYGRGNTRLGLYMENSESFLTMEFIGSKEYLPSHCNDETLWVHHLVDIPISQQNLSFIGASEAMREGGSYPSWVTLPEILTVSIPTIISGGNFYILPSSLTRKTTITYSQFLTRNRIISNVSNAIPNSSEIPLHVHMLAGNTSHDPTYFYPNCALNRDDLNHATMSNLSNLTVELQKGINLSFVDPLGNPIYGKLFLEKDTYTSSFSETNTLATLVNYGLKQDYVGVASLDTQITDKVILRYGTSAQSLKYVTDPECDSLSLVNHRFSFYSWGKLFIYEKPIDVSFEERNKDIISQINPDQSLTSLSIEEVPVATIDSKSLYDRTYKKVYEEKLYMPIAKVLNTIDFGDLEVNLESGDNINFNETTFTFGSSNMSEGMTTSNNINVPLGVNVDDCTFQANKTIIQGVTDLNNVVCNRLVLETTSDIITLNNSEVGLENNTGNDLLIVNNNTEITSKIETSGKFYAEIKNGVIDCYGYNVIYDESQPDYTSFNGTDTVTINSNVNIIKTTGIVTSVGTLNVNVQGNYNTTSPLDIAPNLEIETVTITGGNDDLIFNNHTITDLDNNSGNNLGIQLFGSDITNYIDTSGTLTISKILRIVDAEGAETKCIVWDASDVSKNNEIYTYNSSTNHNIDLGDITNIRVAIDKPAYYAKVYEIDVSDGFVFKEETVILKPSPNVIASEDISDIISVTTTEIIEDRYGPGTFDVFRATIDGDFDNITPDQWRRFHDYFTETEDGLTILGLFGLDGNAVYETTTSGTKILMPSMEIMPEGLRKAVTTSFNDTTQAEAELRKISPDLPPYEYLPRNSQNVKIESSPVNPLIDYNLLGQIVADNSQGSNVGGVTLSEIEGSTILATKQDIIDNKDLIITQINDNQILINSVINSINNLNDPSAEEIRDILILNANHFKVDLSVLNDVSLQEIVDNIDIDTNVKSLKNHITAMNYAS